MRVTKRCKQETGLVYYEEVDDRGNVLSVYVASTIRPEDRVWLERTYGSNTWVTVRRLGKNERGETVNEVALIVRPGHSARGGAVPWRYAS